MDDYGALTMRFMVIVRATAQTESGVLPTAEELTRMRAFNQGLTDDVTMLTADGLRDSSFGARIRFSNGKASVVEGPFTDPNELIAGFWIVSALSREEVVKRFSQAPFENGELEVRQVFELEDFGDLLWPQAKEFVAARRA